LDLLVLLGRPSIPGQRGGVVHGTLQVSRPRSHVRRSTANGSRKFGGRECETTTRCESFLSRLIRVPLRPFYGREKNIQGNCRAQFYECIELYDQATVSRWAMVAWAVPYTEEVYWTVVDATSCYEPLLTAAPSANDRTLSKEQLTLIPSCI
jgi:hypothetical protein